MSAFAAKYAGRCVGGCDGIEPGDEVEYVDDALMHIDCEDAEGLRGHERQATVCTDCFIEKPCECDDLTPPKGTNQHE